MNQDNMRPASKRESRVSKRGRVIKTPKAILTTSSDEAPRRQRSSKKVIIVRNELQRLRAIRKQISQKSEKTSSEEKVAETAAIEKSSPDIPARSISISTNIDETQLPKTGKEVTSKLPHPGCSRIQTPNPTKEINTALTCELPQPEYSKIRTPNLKTAKNTASLIPQADCHEIFSFSSPIELTDEQNLGDDKENSDEEYEENVEKRSEVNLNPVISSLKEILQQNKDIQQQNEDILKQNQELKQQIQNILREQKVIVDECGQRNIGEQVATNLYEPLEGFPLETIEQFREIDSASNKSIRKKLYVHLCSLGGSRVRDFLNRGLKQVMTDKLINQFTWPGCKTSAKFGDTKVANILYLAAQKCPLFRGPDTKTEFEMEMQEVLRSTKQRFRNSIKKSLAIEPEIGNHRNQEQLSSKIKRLEEMLNLSSENEDIDEVDFGADDETED